VSGRADFFLAVRSQPSSSVRARVFGLTGRIRIAVSVRAAKFSFAVRSHPRSSQPVQFFFGCPVASRRSVRRRRNFFYCSSGLICAALFDFFSAWNLCSTPFRNSVQYFFSFYCLKNLLFTAQSRQKFKFFGVFPLTFLAL
jgi:hypothetical protein